MQMWDFKCWFLWLYFFNFKDANKNDDLKQSQPKNETEDETEMFALAYGFWYDVQAGRIKASQADIRNKPDSIRQVLKREWELLDKDKKQVHM